MWTPGEAEAILARSQATAEGIRMVSESFKTEGSTEVTHVFSFREYREYHIHRALASGMTALRSPHNADLAFPCKLVRAKVDPEGLPLLIIHVVDEVRGRDVEVSL